MVSMDPSQRSTVTTSTHTSLTFTMPPGQGKDLQVAVAAGNQVSGSKGSDGRPLVVSYQRPVMTTFAITTAAGAAGAAGAGSGSGSGQCSATPGSAFKDKATANMPQVPTSGGECVTVFGANFGAEIPTVLFGTYAAVIKSRDVVGHSWLTFVIPEGEGKDIDMKVIVGNQEVATKYVDREKREERRERREKREEQRERREKREERRAKREGRREKSEERREKREERRESNPV